MGRWKRYQDRRVSFYLTDEQFATLEKERRETGANFSEIMRRALAFYLGIKTAERAALAKSLAAAPPQPRRVK